MVSPVQFQSAAETRGEETNRPAAPTEDPGFSSVLKKSLDQTRQVKFSAHALKRMNDHNIELTQGDHTRIAEAIDSAQAKAARESLVLMDKLAFVVNVPTRTVITALESHDDKNLVFTNIDSVVVAADSPASKPKQPAGPDPLREAQGTPID